jgi:hypothetical protein
MRYGVVHVDVMQHILEGKSDIRILLSNCSYNTYLTANLHFPQGLPFSTSEGCLPFAVTSEPLSHASDPVESSSTSSDTLFESTSIQISRERFDRLEKQVDDLLAEIINEEDINASTIEPIL